MIKYEEIKRMSDDEINTLRDEFDGEYGEPEALKKIVLFYLPQINDIHKEHKLPEVTESDINIITQENDSDGSNYNSRPNALSCYVEISSVGNFYLQEQYCNCGILTSTNTYSTYPKRGFGTLFHAIKEDIARYARYSHMMYTDRVYDSFEVANQKIMNRIGAKEIWRGYNTRSGNNIAIWMKDINEYYKIRETNKIKEVTEQL